MRRLLVLAIIAATGSFALRGQEPVPRAFLFFIDDLHLDFRQTPRTRKLMQDVLARLGREGDVWSVVTTGTSSLRLPPTTDLAAVRASVSRVTGNALKPAERVPVSPGTNTGSEVQHRADVALRTGADALTSLSAAAPGASLTVLYVSDGYDTRRVTGLQTLIDAAVRARATMFVIKPYGVIEAVSSGVADADWNAYVEATQASLRTLARETGGIAVFTPDDLDPALQRLTKP